jgi:hypothetical protein
MNLRFSTLASALVSTSAWVTTTDTHLSATGSKAYQLSSSARLTRQFLSSVALHSTVTPQEDVTSPALVPEGKPIADGFVVSSFKGGLVAVRVDDDITEVLSKSPEVLDTTNSFPPASKPANLGK